MTTDLVTAIRRRKAILFVGAGVSATLGVPGWKGLIEHMGQELGYQAELFTGQGDYLALAEYYKTIKGTIGPLRSWMDRSWNATEKQLRSSVVMKSIVDLNFRTIFTTNYDHNLENAHSILGRGANKIMNVRDLSRVDEAKPTIVKLHGDFEDDDSIVLTESDYFERLSFDSPLDVRLRSDAIAHPMLFVGYSLSDLNVRLLLHKMWTTWKLSKYESDRPRSYIFLARPNEVQEALLERWGVTAIVSDGDEPGEALGEFLDHLCQQVGPA